MNKIVRVAQKEIKEIKQMIHNDNNVFCVEINGNACMHFSDYLVDISKKFQFPMLAKSLDGYDDWMTDLTWIKQDVIIIIINNYEKFLSLDLCFKIEVLEIFEQSILPWWEYQVSNCVVGGKPKCFNVYLVD